MDALVKHKIDPVKSLRVIASTTYYPVEAGTDDQAMTLRNSLNYVKTNFGEQMSVFKAGETTVVVNVWNNIMFSLNACDKFTEELLEYILQNVKNIAVFLFGPNFESIMGSMSIKAGLQDIFARYVATYFAQGNADFKAFIAVPEFEITQTKLASHIRSKFSLTETPADPDLVECILFKHHQIAARLSNKGRTLDATDVFRLALLEKIQFADAEMDGEVTAPQASSVKPLRVYLLFEGEAKCCYISLVRLGERSPYVLIFASNVSEPAPTTTELVVNMSKQFVRLINECNVAKPSIPPSFQITGLLIYMIVNRTTGECRESAKLKPSEKEAEMKQYLLFEKLRRRMISLSTKTIHSGHLATVRNEMIFQYTSELKFVNARHNIVTPGKAFTKQNFTDTDFSYTELTKNLFPGDNDITCYELMTVYLGVINSRHVIDANSHLFDVLLKNMQQ